MLVLALLLVAGIGLGVWAIVRALDAGTATDPEADTTPVATESVTPTDPAGDGTGDESPTEPEPTEPEIGATPPIPTACTPEEATLAVVTPSSPRAGATVGASIEVATTGTTPCLVDLGSGATTVEVLSGEDLVWTSAHCAFAPSERRLLLGEGATDSQLVTWPGSRSVEGCAAGQATAEPGTYRVVVTHRLDGQTLVGESTFSLS
ncbi:hypothetical protein C8046_15775 [Serinibacter arcticus]|uniref:Uncharacterized protein n=1 Tax=Serinibacter arcticus TaxID=1655435 RepID=A0A2U1ZY43_9MICO|nr:hypothetical protein C8046_15775 [Serinibacter arcticus]